MALHDRTPPHNTDAEQSLLGAMMLKRDAIDTVIGKLKPEYFYKPAHETIFKAIHELYKNNQPIDITTVSDQLKKTGEIGHAGGISYLAEILDSVPTAANIESYSAIVCSRGLVRKVIDAGSLIVSEGFNPAFTATEVLESAQKKILDLTREVVDDHFVKISDILMPVMDNLERVYDKDNKILGVSTGYPDLDLLTSGFQKSDLIILAARPAMGKTALALNIATEVSLRSKIPVAVFSMEMPKEQIAMRLLCSEAGINSNRLRTGQLAEHEYKNLSRSIGSLAEAQLYIDDSPGLTPLELRAKCRRLQVEANIQLIVIDYLQLMRSSKRRVESRYHEMSEVVREIKAFAREMQVPIIALSQLSRDIEKRNDPVPKLSDLRETGEIEQTADLVMFIHRDDYYDGNKSHGDTVEAKLLIAKHRNGPTGGIHLIFKKDISRFYPAIKKVYSQDRDRKDVYE